MSTVAEGRPEGRPLLQIRGLRTYFYTESGVAKAVDGVDLDIAQGEVLGLVGESGSGKSVTALSILRLIPDPPGRIVAGEIFYKGQDLLKLSWDEIREIRGNEISMVFQEPMTSLNPVFTIGMQVTEVILAHQKVTRQEAYRRAVEILTEVGIPEPEKRMKQYPHHFSGGQRQRVMIAIALVLNPSLLIADEPTTGLDATIQSRIVALLAELKSEFGVTTLLITHDIRVVSRLADTVAVMYGGTVMEHGPARDVLVPGVEPKHPYTSALLASLPSTQNNGRRHAVDGRLPVIRGEVVDTMNVPRGCRFYARCDRVTDAIRARCMDEEPALATVAAGHRLRCHLYTGETSDG
jgi:peptide/nickel transport system ATP-binding protein/oligopeptide transport system ATP-binding protein